MMSNLRMRSAKPRFLLWKSYLGARQVACREDAAAVAELLVISVECPKPKEFNFLPLRIQCWLSASKVAFIIIP